MSSIHPETEGINLYSEYSLHEQLKRIYAEPGARLEARVEGKIVDVVRADGELIEIQTAQLGKVAAKATALAAAGHRVRIVFPVAAELRIRRLDPGTGELLTERKSPKKGDLYRVFDELVRAPFLVGAPGITLEVVLSRVLETRTRDGSGSFWRKGDRTIDRELVEVLGTRVFADRASWMELIPGRLPPPWTSATLGEALGIPPGRARKILYTFRRAGLVAEVGKEGRRPLFRPAPVLPDTDPATQTSSRDG